MLQLPFSLFSRARTRARVCVHIHIYTCIHMYTYIIIHYIYKRVAYNRQDAYIQKYIQISPSFVPPFKPPSSFLSILKTHTGLLNI